MLFHGPVAHEVGHTLGLAHNYYAGIAYPTDSLRSATFVHRMGWSPSMMVHLIANPIMLPGDHIPLRDQMMRVGPYDQWALGWIYRPIPEATTAAAELPTLERWRSAQDTAAYLRIYANQAEGTQAYGGDDPVKATALKAQISAVLRQRELRETGDTAALLTRLSAAAPNWQAQLLQLVALIGGQQPQAPYPRDVTQVTFVSIDPARQLEAVRFVLAAAVYGHIPTLHLLTNLSTQMPVGRAGNYGS